METYDLKRSFEMDNLMISPTHVRIERLSLIIAAHRHSNSSYEIHYTSSGHGRVLIGDSAYAVEPGQIYVTGPNVLHAQFSDENDPVIERCLFLNCRTVRTKQERHSVLSTFRDTHFWIGADTHRLGDMLMALIEERRRGDADMEEMSEALLRQIIVTLNRCYRENAAMPDVLPPQPDAVGDESRLYPLVEDAFFYHYKELRLTDLAELLSLSTRQTQRFLLSHYGKSFTQKRTDAQMAATRELLRNTDLGITQIAERAGFSSVEHFSTAFRRYHGCSPRAFRKSEREDRN